MSRGTIHSSGTRSKRQSARAAIRRWWPAASESGGNDYEMVAAHLADPARKTSSSRVVSLYCLHETVRPPLNRSNIINGDDGDSVWIEMRRRRQNDFALRPAVMPAISATDRWSRDAPAIYWESCTGVRLRLLLLLLLLL